MIDLAREFAAVWGPSLWRASWQGGIVLAAAWAIARWCTFLSSRVVCWVWRLACLKLLVALVWITPVQLAVLPPKAPPAPVDVATSASTFAMEQPIFEPEPLSQPAVKVSSQAPSESQAAAEVARAPITLAEILLPAWLLGVAFCVYRSARQWQAARRLVQSSEACTAGRLSALYQDEANRMGVARLPRLTLSTQVEGPLLVGVWRLAIILPRACEQNFDEFELQLMLAHELAHHRRRDLIWNWLPTVATWLFFYHPLVWLMTRSWSEAQEAACDEALIQRRVALPAVYGRLLLKLATASPTNQHAGLAAAGVLGAYRNLERRIKSMARVKSFSARRAAIAAVAVLTIGACGVIPWRLVAQAAEPVEAQQQPAQLTTGTFVVGDEPTKSTADDSANNAAARKTIEKLKTLGVNISSQKSKSADEVLAVGIDPMFQGAGADLKLLDELANVRMFTVDLQDAKALRDTIEKSVAAKEADAKLLDQPMKDVDAAAIGELKFKQPLAQLVILHLTDAALSKMAALPRCRQLSLSSPQLTVAGWSRLAKLAGDVRTLTLQTGFHDHVEGDEHATVGITDEALRSVSQIGSLKSLNLFDVGVTDAGLGRLAALDHLESVSLARCPKAHCAGLANWKQLKKLTIIETPIDAAGMKAIGRLGTLEFLLMQAGELTGPDVAPLAALANLQTLNVTTNLFGEEALKKTPLGDEILRAASALPKLEVLIVTGIGVSDAGLTALKGPQLHNLWLGQINVTDRGLATLATLKDLRNLTLSGKGPTDDSLRHFSDLAALEFLRIDHCEVQGNGLAALAKLDHLKALLIESTPFDDEGALALAKLPALERLSLTRTKITDKGLGTIAALPKLQSLSLAGNDVTIAGLFELRAAKSLQNLEAPDLKAPKEEIAKLKRELPGIEVTTEHSWFYSSNLFVGDDEDNTPAPKITGKVVPASPTDDAGDTSKSDSTTALITSAQEDQRAASARNINVTGRATNADGKPVAGATVYLVPMGFWGGAEVKTFAKTTTNAAGEFEFRDFALPLQQGDDEGVGAYQIYASAPGLGLAWQGTRIFHEVNRPKPGQGFPSAHGPDHVYANDKLTADLRFGSASELRGRFLDEQDKPIVGAKVKVLQLRALVNQKRSLEDRYLTKLADELVAITDAEGRYAISGLPAHCVAILQVKLPDGGELHVNASAADAAEINPAEDGEGIQVGDVTFKFHKARVQVFYGDTDNAAKGASVGAALNGATGVFASAKADDRGLAVLALPAGKYQLGVTPDRATAPIEFVSASLPLVVKETPQEQPTNARIPAGCKLEIEVVDADSGKPIPKIGIFHQPHRDDPNLSGAYFITGDPPHTDKDGRLRLGVEPGKLDVMPSVGQDYEVVDPTNEPVDCIAGKTVSLKFKLRKQKKAEGKAEENPKDASEVKADKPNPMATQALKRLKELGAEPATSKQIGIQSPWKGTDADLKLINELPELDWLYVELDKVGPAGVAEINRQRPIENLILRGLSDATLEKLPRLPACKRLILVNYALTPAGFGLLGERTSGLEILDLTGGPARTTADDEKFFLTDAGLDHICQLVSLKGLQLYNANVTDDGLAQLARLKALEELAFNTCPKVHGARYANLAAVKSLRRLALFAQPIGSAEFSGISKLTQLESLRLNPASVGPVAIKTSDVAELANLTNLQTLDLMAFDWNAKKPFGNGLLRAMGQIKGLRELRLYNVFVEAEGIEALTKNAELRELRLNIEFNERSLAALAGLKQLRKLGLQGEGAVDDAALQQLAKLQPLTELSIAASGIDDRGLALFESLTALEKLVLPKSRIHGAGLASLDKLTKLKTLTIANSPFNDDGAKLLVRLPAIEWLDLSKTKVTDESLAAIAKLKNLRMLTVNDDAVTPKGLLQLADLKRLSHISAEGLAGSKDDLAKMRAAMKDVNISTDAQPLGFTGTAVFVRDRTDE